VTLGQTDGDKVTMATIIHNMLTATDLWCM